MVLWGAVGAGLQAGAGLGPSSELGAGEVSRLEESGRLIDPSASSGYSFGSCKALQQYTTS